MGVAHLGIVEGVVAVVLVSDLLAQLSDPLLGVSIVHDTSSSGWCVRQPGGGRMQDVLTAPGAINNVWLVSTALFRGAAPSPQSSRRGISERGNPPGSMTSEPLSLTRQGSSTALDIDEARHFP